MDQLLSHPYVEQTILLAAAYPVYAVGVLLLVPLLLRRLFPGKLRTADHAALLDQNQKFSYLLDKTQYGINERWKLVKDTTQPFKGDCEDYALALLWRLSGESTVRFWWNMLTCKGVVWHCQTQRGVGHAVLRWKGHWVCNIYTTYEKTTPHKLWFPYLMPLVALKLVIGAVFNKR